MSTSFPMSNPWVDGEGLNSAKMQARVTTPLNDLAAVVNVGVVAAASGTITITPTGANVIASASVTFPAGRFTTAPTVLTQVTSGPTGTTTIFTWPTSVTSTGFTMNLNRSSTAATAIAWLAIDTA